MKRKADVKGGNGDIIFTEEGTAKKYLRNTSSLEKLHRFKREIMVLKKLKEKKISNIVEVLNVYYDENKFSDSYIEMKKYDGSLYDIFKITKGNVKLSFSLILPIIQALYTLSEENPPIYHRDIKPDNILFLKKDKIYTLYLSDFGTCFFDNENKRLTLENKAVGPRNYLAPEYEIGFVENITEKGDIFSIGKVIWSMINGNINEFMPSNFWFIDEYNLTKRFPDNPDMLIANMIISSCLNINPKERCSYSELIIKIQDFISKQEMTITEKDKYKVIEYQEKRKMELIEIKEKNKLLVNSFSQYFITALEELMEIYLNFELIKVFYEGYIAKTTDRINYTSSNVDDNVSHYLYSRSYDRIYLAINYNPAEKEKNIVILIFFIKFFHQWL